MTINTRLGFINISTSDKVIWNIIKNLFVPIWYSDGTVDIQLIPIIAIALILFCQGGSVYGRRNRNLGACNI